MDMFAYGDLLELTSIRLLTLLPAAVVDSDRLECHLQAYQSIQDAPPYEALSYVWGSDVKDRPLVCNAAEMAITESMDVALRRLRGLEPRVLWVDQICINQRNIQERSQQVQIMRDIFSAARRVVIWLGQDLDGKAKSAATLLQKLTRLYLSLDGRDRVLGSPNFPGDDMLAELGLPLNDATEWEDLESMLHLAYFERVWILQEVVLAKERTILWGQDEISWDSFRMGCGWAMINKLHLANRNRTMLSVTGVSAIISPHPQRPWIDWIRETARHNATDPRDKFFALMGIAEGVTSNPLSVDYSKNVAEVYARATTHIIAESKELRILSLGGWRDGDRIHGEPCWTPNFERHRIGQPMDFYLFDFTASRDLEAELQSAAHETILSLKGLKLGIVEVVGPILLSLGSGVQGAGPSVCPPEGAENSYERSVLQSFAVLKENDVKTAARYGCQSNPSLIFAATLGLGSRMDNGGFPTSAAESELFRGLLNMYWSKFLGKLIPILSSGEGEIACPRAMMELVEPAIDAFSSEDLPRRIDRSSSEGFRGWMLPFIEQLHGNDSEVLSRAVRCGNFCVDLFDFAHADGARLMFERFGGNNRRFFITADGSIGIGPRWLEPDDVLAILFGGRSVYALRPTGTYDEYLFMGECYVYGYMNGEAVDQYERGEIQAQCFSLR